MTDPANNISSVSRHNLYILLSLSGFILGVLIASLVHISPLVCILISIVALAIYFVEKIVNRGVGREIILICIALVAISLGAFRYSIKDFHELLPMGATGVVVSEPEHRDTDTRFVFQGDNGERAFVSTDLLSPVEYGDKVQVSAKFVRPGIIDDGISKPFDYGAYLSKDDIYYTASFAKVIKLDEKSLPAHGQASGDSRPITFPLVKILLQIKTAFTHKMKEILPEPESNLLAGLVVAGKQALPKSIVDEFKRAGVIHIVVLSGYNLTVIAEFLAILLSFLGKRRSAAVSAVAVVLFTLMTGATATVVRAAIMVLLLLVGRIIARPGSSPRILLFTAVLMLLQNPKELVFDPSFQLTFLAMLALIYVVPILEAKLAKLKLPAHGQASGDSRSIPIWLAKLLATTLGVQIVVFPFILYNMGNFSTVFLISNLLILLIVPYTMLIGFVATTFTFISTILA